MSTAVSVHEPEVLAPGEHKQFHGTREDWCYAVINVLARDLDAIGITMIGDRQVRVAVTPLSEKKLGQCRSSGASSDRRTNFIDVCTKQADPADLVHTLLHELLHAYDDCNSGHRGRWKRWADQVGIERVGHTRGPVAERLVQTALGEIGVPVGHVTSVRRRRQQAASQIKLVCPGCGFHVFMPRGAFEAPFVVVCYRDLIPLEPPDAAR